MIILSGEECPACRQGVRRINAAKELKTVRKLMEREYEHISEEKQERLKADVRARYEILEARARYEGGED